MKKYLFTFVLLLLNFTSFSQSLGGTLVKGTKPISRVATTLDTIANSNKNTEQPILTSAMPNSTLNSQEVGITNGQLSVSLTGAATYNVPIAVPPGINGVVPQISLSYNSQGGNGLAGYCWNVTGLSSIKRIGQTKYHDNNISPVVLTTNDRFAFDGQRLMLKNTADTYGVAGTVYETESFSNIKITVVGGNNNPDSFTVEYPDGSMASYATKSLTDWAITYWQNPQGVRINYNYTLANNNLSISSISYGSSYATAGINFIYFIYDTTPRLRPEQSYIGGQSFIKNNILKEIRVTGVGGVGFRNYLLDYNTTSLNYQRLVSITEKCGDNTLVLNPTTFSYYDTTETINYNNTTSSLSIATGVTIQNSATIAGDFDGDGKMDFALYPTLGTDANKWFSILTKIDGSQPNIGSGPVTFTTPFISIFATKFRTFQNKLSINDGITTIQRGAEINNYDIKNYYFDGTGIYLQNTKNIQIPTNLPTTFVEGDFDGDGLTDVVAVCSTIYGQYSYFINLDMTVPDLASQEYFATNNFTTPFLTKTGDFNGDGKTDLFLFYDGYVRVYSKGIASIYADPNITLATTSTILLGDFNGDGKTDFLIPQGTGYNTWYKYSATGTTFTKETQVYDGLNYFSPNSFTNLTYRSWITTDFNNDGKTDLLTVAGNRLSDNTAGYVSVICYPNKNGVFAQTLGNFYYTNSGYQADITKWALPIFYNSNQANKKLEVGFIMNNKIHYFQSQKDFNKEKLLRYITNGNGVTETITYKPLEQESTNTYTSPNVYFPEFNYIENYPNTDITSATSFMVVSKLERNNSDANSYKKQFFTYYGAVANVGGLGFLGFRATMHTNWHTGTAPNYLISNVSKNDINLRGANVGNFSAANLWNASSPLPSSSFISKSINTYNDLNITQAAILALQPNKVFKLKIIKSQQFDGLGNTDSETNTTFDAYKNPLQITTNINNVGVTEKTAVTTLTYDAVPTTGTYIVGRPLTKAETATIYPTLADQDIFSTSEIYTYTNNLLTRIAKRGNGSTQSIFEYYGYDLFGNIIRKVISPSSILTNKQSHTSKTSPVDSNPSAAPIATLAPREVDYEYDVAAPNYGRFLTKSYDVEHLATTYNYDGVSGTLSSVINPFSLTTTYGYDKWFKKTLLTDYLGTSKTIVYARDFLNTKITTTSTAGGDPTTEEVYDNLGRKIRSGAININGTWTYVSNLYDMHDRAYKTSEPYFGTTPSQWNETKYDPYGRTIQTIDFTTKTTSIAYVGLVTTVDDAVKQQVITKNALGNIIVSTDAPGGTITNKYFANANLKSSVYDNGGTTTIVQDNWGRKISLTDASAGLFTYTYNLYGETLKEVNPNGNTTYNLDDFGKLLTKKVTGLNSDSTLATNTYDPTTKFLTKTVFNDITAGTTTNYNYGYDSYKRLNFTDESGIFAYFQRTTQFDGFGRPLNQLYSATNAGNTTQRSDKWVNYTYQNGYQYQIKDGINGSGTTLWQTNTVNNQGQITSATLGNGISVANTYDTYGRPIQIKHDKTTTNIITLNYTFDQLRDNLLTRDNNIFGTGTNLWSEDFSTQYDNNNRLLGYKSVFGATTYTNQSYNTNGTINTNNIGAYAYTNTAKPFQATTITPANPSAVLNYYTGREQTIVYSALKKPLSIVEQGQESINFDYNLIGQRATMYYGDANTTKTARPFLKSYSADGTMEVRRNNTTNTIEYVTYIGGDAYTAPLLLKSDGTTSTLQNYLYLHRDYQGSILAITDGTGTVKEKRLFDAWGSLIKFWNNTTANVPITEGVMMLDRGYTGHEHLLGNGLINMNGRLYDPMLHRFLSPDNNLQDPLNTQNYNRYAYVLNNPLLNTDPSGEDGNCPSCPSGSGEKDNGIGYEGSIYAAIIYSIAQNWDDWGIKDWSNQNFNIKSMSNATSDGLKSAENWLGNNIHSFANAIDDGLNSLEDLLSGGSSSPKVPTAVYQVSAPAQLGMFDTRTNSLMSGYNNGVDLHSYAGDGLEIANSYSPAEDFYHFQMQNFSNLSFKDRLFTTAPKNPFLQDDDLGPLGWVVGEGEVKAIEKTYEVYKLINKETQAVEYIGKTKQGIMKRFSQHLLDKAKESWINNVRPVLIKGNLTKFESKFYEQTEIMSQGLDNLYNEINAVSEKYWSKYNIKK